jgi:predicted TIM-barrel fold metal-dependent hydrolase
MGNLQVSEDVNRGLVLPDVSRRATLQMFGAAAASLTLNGCLRGPKEPVLDLPETFALADVHCHIFNITDLPAAEFVQHAFLESEGLGDYAGEALKLVDHLLTLFTPTPDDEWNYLERHDLKDLSSIATIAPETDERRVGALAQFIIARHGAVFGRRTPADALRDVQIQAAPAAERFLRSFYARARENKAISLNLPIEANATAIARTALTLPQVYLAPRNNGSVGIGGGFDCPSPTDTDHLLYTVRWAFFFTYYRHELLAELMRLQGGKTQRIYTPSLNDFDYWLQDDKSKKKPSAQADQIRVMARIAKMKWQNALVQPVCAFDPLRQIVDERLGKPNAEQAEWVVRDAVENQGAVGIKIYPPMGYRPWRNDGLQFFGPRVPNIVRQKYCPDVADDCPNLGAEIDARLARIYDFAVKEDVAILTHVSRSQGAWRDKNGVTSSERANPRWWLELFNHRIGTAQPYKNLRINLGHAGGPWCLAIDQCEATSAACNETNKQARDWFRAVMDALASGAYPNAYADIADLDTVMDEGQDGRLKEIVDEWIKLLHELDAKYPNGGLDRALTHVLYGTDWILLGRLPGSGRYAERMRTLVAEKIEAAFPDQKGKFVHNLFYANAVRFLGLQKPPPGAPPGARERIEKFLGRDPAWIDQAM